MEEKNHWKSLFARQFELIPSPLQPALAGRAPVSMRYPPTSRPHKARRKTLSDEQGRG
jgi:hypothetical protein